MGELDNLPQGGNDTAITSDDDTGFTWDYYDPDDDQDSEGTPATSATDNEEEGELEEAEASEDDGEDTEDGQSEADDEAEETGEDVKPDVEVTLNDGSKVSLQELKDGYYRQSDYSRKTEEVARIRQEYQGKEQQLSDSANKVIRTLQTIDEFMRSELPEPPPPSMATEDPIGYMQQKAIYDHAVGRMGRLQDAINNPREVVDQLGQQRMEQIRQVENQRLAEYFPEMAEPAKRDELRKTIQTATDEVGFSIDELRNIADHRFFRLAHLAAKGLKAEQARSKALKKSENVPPVVAPKAQKARAQATRNRDAMKRLAKSGSIFDAVNVDFD